MRKTGNHGAAVAVAFLMAQAQRHRRPKMSAGWDIVKTDAGYHVTFQADNNEVMLSSEVYESLASAEDAVQTVVDLVVRDHAVGRAAATFRDETQ